MRFDPSLRPLQTPRLCAMVSAADFATVNAQLQAAIAKIGEQEVIIQNIYSQLTMQQQQQSRAITTDSKNKLTFGFGKELCPAEFDGENRHEFKDWSPKMVMYCSSFDNDHIFDAMEWAADNRKEITPEEFDMKADDEDWKGSSGTDHVRFSRMLYNLLTMRTKGTALRIVQNGKTGDGINAWRRLQNYYDPRLASQSQSYLKLSLAVGRAKNIREAGPLLQRFEQAVRRYEEVKGKLYDPDLKIQRLMDILPKEVEQHLMLETRDKEMTYEELHGRAMTLILVNTPANKDSDPMDIGNLDRDEQLENHEGDRRWDYWYNDGSTNNTGEQELAALKGKGKGKGIDPHFLQKPTRAPVMNAENGVTQPNTARRKAKARGERARVKGPREKANTRTIHTARTSGERARAKDMEVRDMAVDMGSMSSEKA